MLRYDRFVNIYFKEMKKVHLHFFDCVILELINTIELLVCLSLTNSNLFIYKYFYFTFSLCLTSNVPRISLTLSVDYFNIFKIEFIMRGSLSSCSLEMEIVSHFPSQIKNNLTHLLFFLYHFHSFRFHKYYFLLFHYHS